MFSFRIHPLFYLLIILFMFLGRLDEIIIAFISVICHELSHVILAYKCGYGINKIELFPFGGMAEYRGLLEMNPVHEILIAISGPFISLLLAGLFMLLDMDIFVKYNLFIGIFNIIPALPLDGGRILRGVLVSKEG
ncbi:MAG: M50 family metallopeptidase, partial [Bacillota bacterium]